jgi:hypothetical protein
MKRISYYDIGQDKMSLCGGDWCLVVPLVLKTGVLRISESVSRGLVEILVY